MIDTFVIDREEQASHNGIPDLVTSTGQYLSEDEPFPMSMIDMEKRFAEFIISRGLKIWSQILIDPETGSTCDFYIWNPQSGSGKLVEITMGTQTYCTGKGKTGKRKARQLIALKNCGVPFTILTRESLERIRTYQYPEFF